MERDLKEAIGILGLYVGACIGAGVAISETVIVDHGRDEAAACAAVLGPEEIEVANVPPACEDYNFETLDTIIRNELVERVYVLPGREDFLQDRDPNRVIAALSMSGLVFLLVTPVILEW